MARDHALALTLPANRALLRLYQWGRPTLSLGRNEPAVGRYSAAAAARLGVEVVRRPTGGRSVLHWRELTYAVIAPVRALGGPRGAYRWINERLAHALRGLGVDARIAADPPAAAPLDAGPCFGVAAGGEVVAGGRKLVGSAQLKVGDALLQHGSILLEDDQELLERLAAARQGQADRPATLGEQLGPVDVDVVAEAVAEAFAEAVGVLDREALVSPQEAELEERYRSEAWTWRR